MFTIPTDQAERLRCAIASRVCFADGDRAYIYRSNGRRLTGRPTRYWVHLSNGATFSITAAHDEEAVSKANARVAKVAAAIVTDMTSSGHERLTYGDKTLVRAPWMSDKVWGERKDTFVAACYEKAPRR
jgi:hypothetical protein